MSLLDIWQAIGAPQVAEITAIITSAASIIISLKERKTNAANAPKTSKKNLV